MVQTQEKHRSCKFSLPFRLELNSKSIKKVEKEAFLPYLMLVLFANISIGDGGKGAAVSPLKLGRNPFRANFLKEQ